MKTTIIYAHPSRDSFNHSLLTTIKSEMERRRTDFEVIDLHQDNFNPVYSAAEFANFAAGNALDPLIKKYQDILLNTDQLVFVFPIWWNDVPAIIKGFIDKVMLKGYAYEINASGAIHGKMTHIKATLIVTTSGAPTVYIKTFAGNGIQEIFIDATLKQLGFKDVRWHNFGGIDHATKEQLEQYLQEVQALLA